MTLHKLIWCFTLLASLTQARPDISSYSLAKRGEVIYTPTDWKLPEDAKLNPANGKPQDKEGKALGFCIRSGGEIKDGQWKNFDSKCWQHGDVLAGKPSGTGPCFNLDYPHANGNARSGYWPGKDVNCILFKRADCQYPRLDEKRAETGSVVLQPPGMAALEVGWWVEHGFKDSSGRIMGPKSYQCYTRGKGNVGLGNDVASMGYVGLGAEY